ncbi:MAG TPA: hypothetical protein VK982_11120 [Bacteroidales bacterium]|nr:hypothetical protein [Bacteroidales bacterium]
MENKIAPIKDPQKLYVGAILYTIVVSKVTKQNINPVKAVVGNEVHFAAIDQIKIKELHLNEGETGLIINKTNENIRVPFDSSSLNGDGDGAIFDEEKKAQAVAKSINITNMQKVDALKKELSEAASFLSELIEKGA